LSARNFHRKNPPDLSQEDQPSHLLVVDDDLNTLELFWIQLKQAGYRVSRAESGKEALSLIEKAPPDLVLLDLMMPGMAGIQACRIIRANSSLPIIVISVYDSLEKKVEALQEGADDYLTKPISMQELLARIRSLLRRSRQPSFPEKICFQVGQLKVDFYTGSITYQGRPLDFTPTENNLMLELLLYPNQVITHDQLLKHVWGNSYRDHVEYLHMYIGRLRKKTRNLPEIAIQNISGTGYMLNTGPSERC